MDCVVGGSRVLPVIWVISSLHWRVQNLGSSKLEQQAGPLLPSPITGYDTACQHSPRPSKSAVKSQTTQQPSRIGSQWHFDEFVNETIAKLSKLTHTHHYRRLLTWQHTSVRGGITARYSINASSSNYRKKCLLENFFKNRSRRNFVADYIFNNVLLWVYIELMIVFLWIESNWNEKKREVKLWDLKPEILWLIIGIFVSIATVSF